MQLQADGWFIVVDQSKLADRLGGTVPVEVVQFGWQSTAKRLAALGSQPVARVDSEGKMFVTDGGNFILDCAFGSIELAAELQARAVSGFLIGAVVAFLIGAGCRYFDIPVPSPPVLPGAFLVVAMTLGYSATDRALTRKAQFATTKHLCGGPSGRVADSSVRRVRTL